LLAARLPYVSPFMVRSERLPLVVGLVNGARSTMEKGFGYAHFWR